MCRYIGVLTSGKHIGMVCRYLPKIIKRMDLDMVFISSSHMRHKSDIVRQIHSQSMDVTSQVFCSFKSPYLRHDRQVCKQHRNWITKKNSVFFDLYLPSAIKYSELIRRSKESQYLSSICSSQIELCGKRGNEIGNWARTDFKPCPPNHWNNQLKLRLF